MNDPGVPTLPARYTPVRLLGEGNKGVVWLVEDMGRQVAMKLLARHQGHLAKPVLEFKQEFRLMSQLRHPNCCAAYDFGVLADDQPYYTMAYLPSPGLSQHLPLDAETFTRVFAQLLTALAHIHQAGLVHGDIKAENLCLSPDGHVTLMDFGLMDYAGRIVGPLRGSFAYMAPERITGGHIDARTDLYAAGALAYEALTGRLPFAHCSPATLLRAQLNEGPEAPSAIRPGIEPQQERLVLKLLAKDPLARYQSAYEVLDELAGEPGWPGGLPTDHGEGALLAAPLIGRLGELAQLEQGLTKVTGGLPARAVWLSGPPGLGKSRLLEALRVIVQLAQGTCGLGHCQEHGSIPYGPFLEALDSLRPWLVEHAPDVLATHGPALTRVWRSEAELPQASGSLPALEPLREKTRVFGAIMALLSAPAERSGLVLMLEDWQWADPLSTELLEHIVRSAADMPLLLVLTARTPPPADAPWRLNVNRLPLLPLSADESIRMALAMLGAPSLAEDFAAQVMAFSAGNPLLIEQLLNHLADNGGLLHERGHWRPAPAAAGAEAPATFRALVTSKLAALSPAANGLARSAAVLGSEFDLALLQFTSGLRDDPLLDALAELQSGHVIARNERETYRFAQEHVQALLLASLPPEERTRLHAAAASAWLARLGAMSPADAPFELVSAIAHHALESGETETAISFALEAGTRAATMFANEAAEHLLSAGLAVLQADGRAVRRGQLFSYLHALGDVRRIRGDVSGARDVYLKAVQLADAFGAGPGLMSLPFERELGQLLISLAKAHQGLDDIVEALQCCERALSVCSAARDWGGASRCLVTSARLRFFQGEVAAAGAELTRALDLARQANDRVRAAEALAFIGYMHVAANDGRLMEGVESLHESIAILSELADKVGLNQSYMLLGNAQALSGDLAGAWTSFSLARWICQEIGNGTEEGIALINLAITALELGDAVQAEELALAARAGAVTFGQKFQHGLAEALAATASAHLGRLAGSRQRVEQALAQSRELGNRYMEALLLPYAAEAALLFGDALEARRVGESWKALIDATGHVEGQSRLHAVLAEALGQLGEEQAARHHASEAKRLAEASHAKGQQARALKAGARLALISGDLARARETSLAGRTLAETAGCRTLALEFEGLLGEVALAEGRPEAVTHFSTLASQGKALGVPLLEAIGLGGLIAIAPEHAEKVARGAALSELVSGLLTGLTPAEQALFMAVSPQRSLLTRPENSPKRSDNAT